MEGFLYKKGSGSSTIGRKNWKKRWFLLDGATLTYYEDFDADSGQYVVEHAHNRLLIHILSLCTSSGIPAGLKGSVQVNNLLRIEAVTHKDYKFTFVLKDVQQDKVVLLLRADDKSTMDLWIRILSFAAKIDANALSPEEQLAMSYELLDLGPTDRQSMELVNKSYRRLCLKHHPDKGGVLMY